MAKKAVIKSVAKILKLIVDAKTTASKTSRYKTLATNLNGDQLVKLKEGLERKGLKVEGGRVKSAPVEQLKEAAARRKGKASNKGLEDQMSASAAKKPVNRAKKKVAKASKKVAKVARESSSRASKKVAKASKKVAKAAGEASSRASKMAAKASKKAVGGSKQLGKFVKKNKKGIAMTAGIGGAAVGASKLQDELFEQPSGGKKKGKEVRKVLEEKRKLNKRVERVRGVKKKAQEAAPKPTTPLRKRKTTSAKKVTKKLATKLPAKKVAKKATPTRGSFDTTVTLTRKSGARTQKKFKINYDTTLFSKKDVATIRKNVERNYTKLHNSGKKHGEILKILGKGLESLSKKRAGKKKGK